MSYKMTSFEGGPVKTFDTKFEDLKLKTPEDLQGKEKKQEEQQKVVQKSKEDSNEDAQKTEQEANTSINDLPDDPNNPTEQFIQKNEDKYLQYLKENPDVADGIQAKINFMKNALAQKTDQTGKVAKYGEKVISQEKPKNFFDAMSTLIEKGISTLNESGIIDQISKIMLQLNLLNPKNKNYLSQRINLSFIESKQSLKKYINTDEGKQLLYSMGMNEASFMKKITDYRWKGKELTNKNGDEYYETNYENSEKQYFTFLSPENQIKYLLRDSSKIDVQLFDEKGEKIKLREEGFNNSTIKKYDGKEKGDSQETQENPNIVKVKGLDTKNPDAETSVEVKGEGDNQYIFLSNGLVLPLQENKASLYSVENGKVKVASLLVSQGPDQKMQISTQSGNDIDMRLPPGIADMKNNPVQFDVWKQLTLNGADTWRSLIKPSELGKTQDLIMKANADMDKLYANKDNFTEDKIKDIGQTLIKNLSNYVAIEENKSKFVQEFVNKNTST